MQRIAVIDADSLIYIVAYHFKDSLDIMDEMFVQTKCQSLLDSILEKTNCAVYKGAFSSPSTTYIRSKVYKYKVYKGNRPPKPEWITFWEKTIVDYYISVGFIVVPEGYEADDWLEYVRRTSTPDETLVYCSTDKDVKQIPGTHFDIRTMTLSDVTELDALKLKYTLLLIGDTTDNISGINGIGEVKASKLLEDVTEEMDMYEIVLSKYLQAYGPYYGQIIFEETFFTVSLHSWN